MVQTDDSDISEDDTKPQDNLANLEGGSEAVEIDLDGHGRDEVGSWLSLECPTDVSRFPASENGCY